MDHDVVRSQAIQQYLSTICMIFAVQKHQGHVIIEVGALMSDLLKDLLKLVCKRNERVLVELSKEQLNGEFQPFMLVEKIPKIEDEL